MKENYFEKQTGIVLLLMVLAYAFSMVVRMYWPIYFMDNDTFRYAGELMINTNDGYAFANAARDILSGVMPEDGVKQGVHQYSIGLVYLSAMLTKWTPFSLETVILYLPAIVSSLVVVPIVLTARLMGHTLLGFFAALLGSIAWSYYNRTMVGYYDTDMFSVLLQFSIFYAMLHVVYKKDMFSVLLTSFLIFIYPYFYPQGMSIVFAMFVMLVGYLSLEYKGLLKSNETSTFKEGAFSFYGSVVLLSIALMLSLPVEIRLALFFVALIVLLKVKLTSRQILYIAIASFIGFLIFSNIFGTIIGRVFSYLDRGVEAEGLHFYQVVQTIREAGAIPFSTMANRISGSQIGVILSLLGYILLVLRHKPFIIALPMIGVGVLSLWAGLRFTVYAVPIAALSAVFFFWVVSEVISKKNLFRLAIVAGGTAMLLYPNITHVIGYKVPTVLNKTEVQDLKKLKKISTSKDYTLTWWDYGYPIWFYSNTNTLIDGGKHTNDNFIISKILLTPSAELAANLSRLAIESYVDSNYTKVTDVIFHNKEENQTDPNVLLSELESGAYVLPKKSRDVFLYLPFRMMNILPTVAIFGNIDLTTGKEERKIAFYPSSVQSNKDGIIYLRNGIVFDIKKGTIEIGRSKGLVKNFIVTQNRIDSKTTLQSQMYHMDGSYAVVYMKSYGQFIVMDTETFKSTYVQMFILGKYDKKLFELVVSSPYTKIYRLKR